jgi:hypothetical protein
MQFHQNLSKSQYFLCVLCLTLLFGLDAGAQVNTVEFGKNRVQYRKLDWKYFQTPNFNTYYYEKGQTIANFVAQMAEEELPEIEKFMEYGLQRRANIVIYNSYNEYEQSNIGLSMDWQATGGITQLVNNKLVVFFNSDHSQLRKQIRLGIAKTLLDNVLFGDDLGEFAANQALLDLPKWLTDGYVYYVAENWNTDLDDQLKSAMLSGRYKNFYQFAHEKPELAGHAFWNYIEEIYKKENVTYFLYLARVYRNLNAASNRIAKMKFKDLLANFMTYYEQKYYEDIKNRRNFPKGTISLVEEISDKKDFFQFAPNPAPRSMTYAVVEYVKGKTYVVLYENMVDRKVLLKQGIKTPENQLNPNYPLLAWDGKGTKLACIYWEKGEIKLFVYDLIARYKTVRQSVTPFELIQSFGFMLNDKQLLMSAVRNGQSDIFIYNIEKDDFEQVTNDAYADLDPTFVAFPNKTGILFSSNRPDATTLGKDTAVPGNRFNIFLADNFNKSEFRQITQLTKMQYGTARYPAQYNTTHFTFVSDETGIFNRYAGYFTTERAGLDTVFVIGGDHIRNPLPNEIDSALRVHGLQEPDSIYTFSITKDSSYVFPITNYQSGLLETKIAGDNGMVSEVRQEGNMKFLYKLRVDETALRRRNVSPRPTDYRQRTIAEQRLSSAQAIDELQKPDEDDDAQKPTDIFETEFAPDTSSRANLPWMNETLNSSVLQTGKRYDYRLKFAVDNFTGGFNNDVLINRYQPFTGSLPVNLQGNGSFNGMLKASVFDLFEDIRFTGGVRLPILGGSGGGASFGPGGVGIFVPATQSLFSGGGEWFGRIDYLKHRFDYSLVYYRKTDIGSILGVNGNAFYLDGKMISNLYQVVVKYPFDKVRSLRMSAGIRRDRVVVLGELTPSLLEPTLKSPDLNRQTFAITRFEYVHDNTLVKTMNILNGLRFKVYTDLNSQINSPSSTNPDVKPYKLSFNFGGDARLYVPIYRNFIWAGRAAADFSWGNQKIVYYLGGTDNELFPKYNMEPRPMDNDYAFQSLAVNMRGFRQNVANGNNAIVLNSEFRFPVFATLFNKPINNAFLRNFQLVQFVDLGSAWNGKYDKIERPALIYPGPGGNTTVRIESGGIGPFVGGYGFGVRSTLLGYFVRMDAGWEMNGFFSGKPVLHFSLGVDF